MVGAIMRDEILKVRAAETFVEKTVFILLGRN